MQNLRFLACVVAALGSVAIAGCGSSSNDCDDSNNNKNCVCDTNGNCVPITPPPAQGALVVQNQSGFAVTEIHVASVGSTTWGANLITGTLASGASFTLSTVSCGHYDALLVDAAGEQCILHDVDLCAANAAWIIGNATCATFTKQS